MSAHKFVAIAVTLGLAVGCATSPNDSTADAKAIRSLLLARHQHDLPTRAILDHHGDAETVLIELATTDPKQIVRARALALLGRAYGDDRAERVLTEVARDAAATPKLRAAAVRGLASYDLASRPDLRAVIDEAARSTDLQVATVAAAALGAD